MRTLRLALVLATSLSAIAQEAESPMTAVDLHSHAQPDRVRTVHLDLELTLDFERHVARGTATHQLERRQADAPFVVDTDGLRIHAVRDQHGEALSWHQPLATQRFLGRPLQVALRADTSLVAIDYETSPDAEAMQWLSPEQTDGKAAPFLFTQGQAILTRTWIPLQDSPAVRITWSARVHAPAGLVPVMSAEQRSIDQGVPTFHMTRPVPSYLIALACGDLQSRPISERCAVWAEPAIVDAAAAELADMEKMVVACEQLFGPYRWGRYDVLFLPPSFPFGGMENPCLTFATPTILAGDKSLVALIAHELAHSWSGNLVTNATWRDFWLNEGFTVYLENRIMEHVYGPDRAAMEIALGVDGLRRELAALPAQDQVLHIDLAGRNPDDGMTSVPYEKGAGFLRRLEQVFGRERLDAFLRAWFDGHSFQSVTTETFLGFLREHLLVADPALAAKVDVERWVAGAGIPDTLPVPTSTLFAQVDEVLLAWRAGTTPAELQTAGWVTQQWLRFLNGLAQPTKEQLSALDEAFALTRSGNSEILCVWMALAVRCGYHGVDRRLDLFLQTVGRRKFLKPLYEALLAADDGRTRALAIYRKARPRSHAVSQRTLDAMLGYDPAHDGKPTENPAGG